MIKLKAAAIEFNTTCTLGCIMCPYPYDVIERQGTVMADETFYRIAEQIRPFTKYVYIGGYGEFLLHSHFAEYVRELKKFAKLNLATNLTVLSEENLDALMEIDDLSVSISGWNKELYALMHGRNKFETVVQNIERLRKRGKQFSITYVRTCHNDQMERAKRVLGEFNYKDLALPMRTVMEHLLPSGSTRFLRGPLRPKADISKCHEMWEIAYFLSNGDVTFCCYDYNGTAKLGNINEQSFREIWDGEPYRKLRASHAARKFHPVCLDQCSLM